MKNFFAKVVEFCKKVITKVVAFCKYIGIDGLLHLCITALLVEACYIVMPLHISALVTLLVSIVGKEVVWDLILGKGTTDLKDIACDIWGTMCGLLLLLFLGCC